MNCKFFTIACALLSMSFCSWANENKTDSVGYQFTVTKELKTNPVKDQSRSGTCWSFSTLSFIEDDLLRQGKPAVDLSEMFIVRNDYIEKAIKYVRMHGDIAFSAGGSAYDVLYIIDKYGIVPEKFTYNGVEYTPQSFAKSLGIKASDYVPLTSFTHHDFYKPFAIEVPDNWLWSEYYNIPLNELMETIDYAIDKGFTVMWASDVSEKGFQYLKGFAVVPVEKKNENLSGTELARWVKLSKSEKEGELYKFEEPEEEQYIDQKLRQEAFDNYETTDDHGMVFVGTAVDQNGTKYYKVKNSWGTEQIYGGFFYASEAFVKYKTMDILVHKDAVPVKILKKLHLK
ncbi:aminopeptidase [Barnesiella intestinihominis]|uniref:aminopeptidase C n=1 Tax=Barnesiella intestinihominis TaxID=487174 RepID=UPI001C01A6CC|nr:C1 family peptidase [Barnesiella intestinihominis]MBT9842938.1 aminopeptidase [Barnesiella intestinihominis]